ncbi:MAG TPA: ParB/RepB/Spo0J family partition protein [Bacillota bacterium]|nr:ParB/RepB/Spo0J family partition protein [Bacillota bacterium]
MEDRTRERMLDLGNGLSIWKIHIDLLREADKNARVMSPMMLNRLTDNVRQDGRLESLPLVTQAECHDGEMRIISGHHRVRAARAAEVYEVHVLCIDDELSRDQILSKQLQHNSLNGEDDPQMLAELYRSIEDLNERIKVGLPELEAGKFDPVGMDEVRLDVDYEVVNIVFLPQQKVQFDDAINLLAKSGDVLVEQFGVFESFREAVAKTSEAYNVRNIAGILAKMAEIVLAHEPQEEAVPDGEPAAQA